LHQNKIQREMLTALQQCEQQIIAHSAVIEALRELWASATMEPDEP
jgi:hypothetical protein